MDNIESNSASFSFDVMKKDAGSHARVGILKTLNKTLFTPNFMPVATYANVRAVNSGQIEDLKVDIIISNSYHLLLRPGLEVLKKAGGIHKFMNFKGAIVTDSGGFQILSLSSLRKVEDEGVMFKSHIDGSLLYLTPEKAVQSQRIINSDIGMMLDVCPGHNAEYKKVMEQTYRTCLWAKRAKNYIDSTPTCSQQIFGIIQGGVFEDLRKYSLEKMIELDFPGYAIGGVAVGESKENLYKVVEITAPYLPLDKIRYLMGVGFPEDIIRAVKYGVDLFDCVVPTRHGRTGTLYTLGEGKINIKNAKFKDDLSPVEAGCDCYTCRNHTRSYLRHLFKTRDSLSGQLATLHNIRFFMRFMDKIRENISQGNFPEWSKGIIDMFEG